MMAGVGRSGGVLLAALMLAVCAHLVLAFEAAPLDHGHALSGLDPRLPASVARRDGLQFAYVPGGAEVPWLSGVEIDGRACATAGARRVARALHII